MSKRNGRSEKRVYSITLSAPDEEGAIVVTASHLHEVATYGRDRDHAMEMAEDAVHVAIAARIHFGVPVPESDASDDDELTVAVNISPAPRSPRIHVAAFDSGTLVVFPARQEDRLPPPVVLRIVRRLRLGVPGLMDIFNCTAVEAREILAADEAAEAKEGRPSPVRPTPGHRPRNGSRTNAARCSGISGVRRSRAHLWVRRCRSTFLRSRSGRISGC